MDRRRLILWSVLAVSLLFTLWTSPLSKMLFATRTPAPPPRPQASAPPAAAVQAPPPTLTADDLARWRDRYAHAWKRDPFFTTAEEQPVARARVEAPSSAPTPTPSLSSPPSYTVKVVLISGASKVAAIDSRLVSEGEMLGDERVAQILPEGVVLERGGTRRLVGVAGGAVSIVEGKSPSGTGERLR